MRKLSLETKRIAVEGVETEELSLRGSGSTTREPARPRRASVEAHPVAVERLAQARIGKISG